MKFKIPFCSPAYYVVAGLVLATSLAPAQNTGWRRLNTPAADQTTDPTTPVAPPDVDAEIPPANPPANAPLPGRLTIEPGTFLTVRINQPLSTDRNHEGDFFSATLAEPVVVDGVVVAQRGQTLAGRVSKVDRGGRVSGVSQLGIELTSLTAVDGQQVGLQTQLINRDGHSTAGRDVATVGTTTGVGAAIGAAADWGRGAAIGAGVGAAAGLAGVLLSRGAPAVVYPESLLTFRVTAPATVATDRAPQAFRYVDANDYQQPQPPVQSRVQGPPPAGPAPYYAPYPYPYAAPYPYYAYGYPYPYYYGPSFGIVIGPRYGYYRGGYYRGWRR
ncbi:MAG TPA: hypothetical protein VKT49_25185 [Bryobacteraceae bacterium]|nr:hypothetical protein [Bryobacteraceae bacterium]